MYNEGFQPWYRDRVRFNLRGTTTRQYFATEEGLAAINTMLNANFKYLWMPAILYCKHMLSILRLAEKKRIGLRPR